MFITKASSYPSGYGRYVITCVPVATENMVNIGSQGYHWTSISFHCCPSVLIWATCIGSHYDAGPQQWNIQIHAKPTKKKWGHKMWGGGLPLSLLILYLGSSDVALKFLPYSLVALVSFSTIWPVPLPVPYFHDTLSPALNSGFVISFPKLYSQIDPTSSTPGMAHFYVSVCVFLSIYVGWWYAAA